jgi:EAL domain-containing protein (putative c-di-GMP-specific phosphodiesterase class I)
MDVVAEGVETEDQLKLLRKLECEHGQGFLFSTPLGDGQVDQFIANSNLDTYVSKNRVKLVEEAPTALVA